MNKSSRLSALLPALLILLVAAVLRLVAFGDVPPGLYHDEAYYGLDAVDVLRGHLSVYFPANNGREPLFIYLAAGVIGLLGRSPFALRMTSFFVGILTVAATAAAGRALFSRRVGLLAAAVLAVTLWHIHLSRVAFRAVTMPLMTALTIWQGAMAARTGRKRHWLAAGILYGLSLYTYIASRFTPVALGAFGLYVLAGFGPRPLRTHARGVGLAVLAAVIALAPLAVYTARHPDVVLGRPNQVSVFNPAISGGDPWGTLGRHFLRTLGMFFVRGDRIWRHNVPWRPVFDPLLGAAFLLGLGVALQRMRRNPAAGFALIWTASMALPTILAEDAPHFLRAVGMLPVLMFLPALGLDWLTRGFRSGYGRAVAPAVLLFGLVSTVRAYFGPYARDPMTGYWFERGAVVLGAQVNRFLGVGWSDEAPPGTPSVGPTGRVYLEPALWEEWSQVRFLVAARERVTVGLEGSEVPTDAGVAIFVWPYGDWSRAWALLPHPAEVTVMAGPLSQYDRGPEPFVTYLAFFATPPGPISPPAARLSGGVEFLGAIVQPAAGGSVWVRLRWRATAPLDKEYAVFLHYRRDGQTIAQGDSPPVGGRYPTTLWHPGDIVDDDHLVPGVGAIAPGRDEIVFGLWNPQTGEYLSVLDEAGNPAGVEIRLPARP